VLARGRDLKAWTLVRWKESGIAGQIHLGAIVIVLDDETAKVNLPNPRQPLFAGHLVYAAAKTATGPITPTFSLRRVRECR